MRNRVSGGYGKKTIIPLLGLSMMLNGLSSYNDDSSTCIDYTPTKHKGMSNKELKNVVSSKKKYRRKRKH